MVDYNLINSLDVNEDSFEQELAAMMGGQTTDEALATTIDTTLGNFQTGAILKGRVVDVRGASWRARTNRATPVPAGDPVRVIEVDGLLLEVEPLEGAARDHRERRRRDDAADHPS